MKIRLSGIQSEIDNFINLLKCSPVQINSISLPYANNRKTQYSKEVRVYIDLSINSNNVNTHSDTTESC